MRAWLGVVLVAAVSAASACASKPVALPTPSAPRFADFVEPLVPAELAGSPAIAGHERAWRFLQSGDLRNADREVAAVLKRSPTFYPTETVAGYVELARKDERAAAATFDRALSRRADYVAALVGKGQALAALDQDGEALEAFDAALRADPSLTGVQRRVEVTRLRIAQRGVTAARQSVKEGKFDEAMQTYREAIERSPDSAFLYRELALLERDQGNGDAAIDHYQRAAALDPTDAESLVDLAEMLDARDNFDAALKAYDAALALGSDASVTSKRDVLRLRAEVSRLPPEYRAIESAPQITRSDLAALIGFRLAALLRTDRPRDVGVITDIRGHWAEPWMLAVAAAGLMDPYENHTFQPRALVRRVDFAQTVTRLLNKVATAGPVQARGWENARGQFPDITATHVAYPAASVATAAGVMTTAPDGAFQPTRLVTGAEAAEALRRVRAIADTVSGSAGARP